MSKKKHSQQPQPPKPGGRAPRSAWVTTLYGIFNVIATMVDRLGWGGAMVVLVFFFVQYNGTPDQKERIIERFVLGKNPDQIYPYLGLGALGIIVFVGQNYYWRKKNKILSDEIDRLSKWKSNHQQQAVGTNLHHTENSEIK